MHGILELAARKHPPFGEYLVAHRVLDRFQLLLALQLQDRMPRARLGHCVAVLGYAPRTRLEQMHAQFARRTDDDLGDLGALDDPDAIDDAMVTTSFQREPEIELEIEIA